MIGMQRKVKEPRINLRFSSRNVLDDMSILAHSNGLTLPAWAKATLIRELIRSETTDILTQQSIESLLTMQALMELDYPQSKIRDAKQTARSFIQQIQNRDV